MATIDAKHMAREDIALSLLDKEDEVTELRARMTAESIRNTDRKKLQRLREGKALIRSALGLELDLDDDDDIDGDDEMDSSGIDHRTRRSQTNQNSMISNMRINSDPIVRKQPSIVSNIPDAGVYSDSLQSRNISSSNINVIIRNQQDVQLDSTHRHSPTGEPILINEQAAPEELKPTTKQYSRMENVLQFIRSNETLNQSSDDKKGIAVFEDV
jgi:hypothetical protein